MDIFEQEWFWIGAFSIISVIAGSLLTTLGISIKEIINRSTQIKIEKIKIYDEKKFQAYSSLYDFISIAFSSYWPPDEPIKDFSELMKYHFFTKVKNHYPYFQKKIRNKLKTLEAQYECLMDPDLNPKIPLDAFLKKEYLKTLSELNKNVEIIFSEWIKS